MQNRTKEQMNQPGNECYCGSALQALTTVELLMHEWQCWWKAMNWNGMLEITQLGLSWLGVPRPTRHASYAILFCRVPGTVSPDYHLAIALLTTSYHSSIFRSWQLSLFAFHIILSLFILEALNDCYNGRARENPATSSAAQEIWSRTFRPEADNHL